MTNRLEWFHHETLPLYYTKSPAAKSGAFSISYDDVMYWDTFSNLSPTQNLESIKQAAQEIHETFINMSK